MADFFETIAYPSESMQKLHKALERFVQSAAPIFFWGETGSGMGFYAKALHEASRTGKFVSIPCFSLDEASVQQQFLGIDDQPGWLEEAQNGTIFLKRVAETPLAAQPTLHHLITAQSEDGDIEFSRKGSTEPHRVNVRFVFSAANEFDLMVQDDLLCRHFIEDIRRLGKIIRIPPLREHKDDIAVIAHRLFQDFASQYGSLVTSLDQKALKLLTAYSWPGNVYELRRVLRGIIQMSPEITAISDEHIPDFVAHQDISGDRYAFKLKDDERFKGKIRSHFLRVQRDRSKFRMNTGDLVEILRVEDTRFAPPKLKHYAFRLKDGSRIAAMILDKTLEIETSFDAHHQIEIEDLQSLFLS